VERDHTAPIEIYNLAAQSHVKISFDMPIYTANTDAIGPLNILEAVKSLGLDGSTRIYQASTSELYGSTPPPQSETTLMCPQSPYAISKLFAFWIVKNYRDAYGMYVVNGILFNHESERRPENFVSRKITSYVARYYKGLTNDHPLELGNLYAKRDWGYAKDFVQAMWAILQKDTPQDYVIATGKQYTVKEFVDLAFKCINVTLTWKGDEAWDGERRVVVVNPAYFRPTEVESLCGNADLARNELGWTPKTSLEELVKIMVHYDIHNLLNVTR
jgi:GDPmannose 4,6-dehydratase